MIQIYLSASFLWNQRKDALRFMLWNPKDSKDAQLTKSYLFFGFFPRLQLPKGPMEPPLVATDLIVS